MEALKLLVVFLLVVLLQVMGAVSAPLSNEEQDAGIWSLDTWQEYPLGYPLKHPLKYPSKYPLERGLRMRLAEIIKRSKAEQFHGLMGRSPGISQSMRMGKKREYYNAQRNKGEVFVGLMGRRSLGEESEDEWDIY